MQKTKISFIMFDLESQWNIHSFEWRKTEIMPDYRYHNQNLNQISNQLFEMFPVIRLNSLEQPWIVFRLYFTDEKVNQLRMQLSEISSENTKNYQRTSKTFSSQNNITQQNIVCRRIKKQNTKSRAEDFLKQSKMFDNLLLAGQILDLRKSTSMTLKQIAAELKTSFSRIMYVWRLLRGNGSRLVNDQHKLDSQLILEENFLTCFGELIRKNNLCMQPLKTIFVHFAKEYPYLKIRNLAHFRKLVAQHGFIYRHAYYISSQTGSWSRNELNFAALLMSELVLNPDTFDVLWIDESSICPTNFKQKGWGYKHQKLTVSSRIKYDGIKLFGVLSRTKIFALQFLKGNASQVLFDFFIIQVMKRYLVTSNGSRIPVLFMDNSPLHRSKELERFCRNNKIMIVFNLAHNPELNAIERLWRFLKHPLKSHHNVCSE